MSCNVVRSCRGTASNAYHEDDSWTKEGAEHVSRNNRGRGEPILAAGQDGNDDIVTSDGSKSVTVAVALLRNESASIAFGIEDLARRHALNRQRADPSNRVPADGLVGFYRVCACNGPQ